MSYSEIAPRCVPGGWGLQCRGSRGPGPQDKNLDSLLRVQRSVWCLAGEYWDQSPGHWPWGGGVSTLTTLSPAHPPGSSFPACTPGLHANSIRGWCRATVIRVSQV